MHVQAEHLVAGSEAGSAFACGLDGSGEFHSEDGWLPGLQKATDDPYNERNRLAHAPVGGTDRGRMDANENVFIARNRLRDVLNLNDVRRPVSAMDGGSHVFA
jgi:hypothetical protein